jgi:hypothetical protein
MSNRERRLAELETRTKVTIRQEDGQLITWHRNNIPGDQQEGMWSTWDARRGMIPTISLLDQQGEIIDEQ